MRVWIFGLVAACGAPPVPARATEPPARAPSTRAVAEPWTPPPRPPEPPVTGPIRILRRGALPSPGSLGADAVAPKRSDLWSSCVRDVASRFEPRMRDLLGDVLTAYFVGCDGATGTVTLGSRVRAGASVLGIAGTVSPTSARLELAIMRRGEVPPERITILAGATRWTSTGLDPVVDRATGQSTATLPLTRALARVVRTVLDSDEPIVRFEASDGDEDVVISEDEKQELRVLLELADVLTP